MNIAHSTSKYLIRCLSVASATCFILSFSGCSTIERNFIEPNYRPPAMTSSSGSTKSVFESGGKTFAVVLNKEGQIDGDKSDLVGLQQAAKSDPTARDFLTVQFINVSDNLVERHKADLLGNYSFTNATLGILTSAAGGLAAIVSPPGTKSAFGAGAAFLNSSRSTVNEQIFLNQVATTIIRAIDTERGKLRVAIESKLGKPLAEYSSDQALLDVQAYHNAGSFAHGLVLISDALSKQRENTTDLETRIAKLKKQYDISVEEAKALTGVAQTDALARIQVLKAQIDLLRAELASAPSK